MLMEEERRNDELRGRLEESRLAKNMIVSELEEVREQSKQKIKEMEKAKMEQRKELDGLLQTERDKNDYAALTIKVLEENVMKAEQDLEELKGKAEKLQEEVEMAGS